MINYQFKKSVQLELIMGCINTKKLEVNVPEKCKKLAQPEVSPKYQPQIYDESINKYILGAKFLGKGSTCEVFEGH